MRRLVVVLSACAMTTQAIAGTAMLPQPFQVGEETARYNRGVPTVTLEKQHGGVQITPLPMDHGSLAFMIAVYNDGRAPTEFDTKNITAKVADTTLAAFTVDELEKAAKNRAMWSQIGVALLAGAAATAAAQAHTTNTYRSRMYTPRGTYSFVSSYRDNSIGVLGATAATAAGVAGVVSIQGRLDATLAQLNEEGLQRTTVDPGESYGGRVVLQKIPAKAGSRDVRVNVAWNGETYQFGLHIPAKGDPELAAVRGPSQPSRNARDVDARPAVVTPEPVPVQPAAAPLAPAPVTSNAAAPVIVPPVTHSTVK